MATEPRDGLDGNTGPRFPRMVEMVIKNPYNPNIDTVKVRLEMVESSSVYDVKELLRQEYPSNPACDKQRLIYFGKMLADESLLVDVFSKADLDEPQTLHLLIPVTRVVKVEAPVVTQPQSQPLSPSMHDDIVDMEEDLIDDGDGNLDELEEDDDYDDMNQHGTHVYNHGYFPQAQQQQPPSSFAPHSPYWMYQQQLYYQQQLHVATLANLSTTSSSNNLMPRQAVGFDFLGRGGLGSASGVSAAMAFLQQEEKEKENDAEENHNIDEGASTNVDNDNDEDEDDATAAAAAAEDSSSTTNEEEEPIKSYDECIEQLKVHYNKLMEAIEISQRIQASNMSLLSQAWGVGGAQYNYNPQVANFSPGFMQPPPAFYHHQQYHHAHNHSMDDELYRSAERSTVVGDGNVNNNNDNDNDNNEHEAHVAEENDQGRAPAVFQRVIVINVRLIIKLALLLYFLSNDTSSPRFYMLLFIASMIYFYETGYLEPILGTREAQREFIRRLRLEEMGHIATRDQVGQGLVTDSYYFMKTFVLSMIPSWRVVARSDPESTVLQQDQAGGEAPPAMAPIPADGAAADNLNNNNNNAGEQ